jgi:hypothetical protein
LYDLLKKERLAASPDAKEEAEYRKAAEKVLGDDEHLLRVEWVGNILS